MFRRKVKQSERRRYARMQPGGSRGTCSAGEVTLLNISPIGLGFATSGGSGLTRGEQHLVIVEDARGRAFEALAEVCWFSEDSDADGRHRVGLAFVSILRDDPAGLWAGVGTDPWSEAEAPISWNLTGHQDLSDSEALGDEDVLRHGRSRVLSLDAFRRRNDLGTR